MLYPESKPFTNQAIKKMKQSKRELEKRVRQDAIRIEELRGQVDSLREKNGKLIHNSSNALHVAAEQINLIEEFLDKWAWLEEEYIHYRLTGEMRDYYETDIGNTRTDIFHCQRKMWEFIDMINSITNYKYHTELPF